MKIYELVEMYKKNPRINLEKELEVQKYISIAYKREMANLILDNWSIKKNGNSDFHKARTSFRELRNRR